MLSPHNLEMAGNSEDMHDGRKDADHEKEIKKAEHCSADEPKETAEKAEEEGREEAGEDSEGK